MRLIILLKRYVRSLSSNFFPNKLLHIRPSKHLPPQSLHTSGSPCCKRRRIRVQSPMTAWLVRHWTSSRKRGLSFDDRRGGGNDIESAVTRTSALVAAIWVR